MWGKVFSTKNCVNSTVKEFWNWKTEKRRSNIASEQLSIRREHLKREIDSLLITIQNDHNKYYEDYDRNKSQNGKCRHNSLDSRPYDQ